MTNSKRPVNAPDDLKGLKMRTMENPVHMQAYKAFGIIPTPMAFTEVFTALQQGTVDGQENPLSVISAAKFDQVQKYMTLTGHVYSPALILMNKAQVGQALRGRQAGVRRGREGSGEGEPRAHRRRREARPSPTCSRKGMTIVENVDKAQVPGSARRRRSPSSARSSARTTSTRSATPSSRVRSRRRSPDAELFLRVRARAATALALALARARCSSPRRASGSTRSCRASCSQQPAEWSEVLVRFTLIWMVFLGAPVAFRQGAMVCVDCVYRMAGPTGKRVLDWLVAHRARWC